MSSRYEQQNAAATSPCGVRAIGCLSEAAALLGRRRVGRAPAVAAAPGAPVPRRPAAAPAAAPPAGGPVAVPTSAPAAVPAAAPVASAAAAAIPSAGAARRLEQGQECSITQPVMQIAKIRSECSFAVLPLIARLIEYREDCFLSIHVLLYAKLIKSAEPDAEMRRHTCTHAAVVVGALAALQREDDRQLRISTIESSLFRSREGRTCQGTCFLMMLMRAIEMLQQTCQTRP